MSEGKLKFWEDPAFFYKIVNATPFDEILANDGIEESSSDIEDDALNCSESSSASASGPESQGEREEPEHSKQAKPAPQEPGQAEPEHSEQEEPRQPEQAEPRQPGQAELEYSEQEESRQPEQAEPEPRSKPKPQFVPQPVDEGHLKFFPYHSVGKILWTEKNEEVYSGSAFYVGSNKIMTAAHLYNRKRYKKEDCVFIPAMKDRYDHFGKLFGIFEINEVKRLLKYERKEKLYDICVCEVKQGRKMSEDFYKQYPSNEEGLQKLTGSPAVDLETMVEWRGDLDQAGLTRIPLRADISYDDFDTEWTVVGYGRKKNRSEVGGERDGWDGTMSELSGRIITNHMYRGEISMVNVSCLKGMSGGPWLLGCGPHLKDRTTAANGCQSGASKSKSSNLAYFSTSVYFSSDLLESLGIMNAAKNLKD
jgi:hypothetical protein